MQVTLHGGPHDGRRVHIDPATAATGYFRIHDEPARPAYALPDPGEHPTAITQIISIYRAQAWRDGPYAPGVPTYTRWTYQP